MLIVVDREAFDGHYVRLQDNGIELLGECVWDGPKGFPCKPVLLSLYGRELDRLFQDILNVPNATGAEVQEYLEQLRKDDSTTITDVTEVYVYIQDHYD